MSNLLKSKFLMGVMVVAIMFVGVVAVANTSEAACSITTTLRLGSTGSEVVCLQTALGGLTADGSFGPKTAAAVKVFQANEGLTADGVFGPMSRAAWMANQSTGNFPAGCTSASGYSTTTGMSCAVSSSLPAGCTSTSGYSPTTGAKCSGSSTSTGPLAGTDGTISDVNELSQYNNEEVGENSSNTKVLGMEVEASNDGDIEIRSVKVSFDSTGNTGSDHLDDYIDSVSVWMGSTKVGSADVSDFNEDTSVLNSKTITLSGAVVRADQTEKFYVAVDSVNNLDSSDITGDSWTVDVDSIRFEDGSGVVSTDTTTGDIDGMDVPVDFVSFSAAADTELKVSTDSSTPEAGIVIVDTSDNTDNVVLLKGKLKLEGDSDVNIDALPVTLTVGGATNIDAVANSLTLILDGTEYTESLGTNCAPSCAGANSSATVTFDNLDFDLSAGDTVNFEVRVDVNDIEAGVFDEGDTLLASLTTTNRNEMDAENEERDQLSDSSEKSGSATGEAQEFRSQGIVLTLVDTDAVKSAVDADNGDSATFTIKFKVTAVGDNVYVATTASTGGSINNTYTVYAGSTATLTDVSEAIVNKSDTDVSSGGNWLIEDGSSETLEMTVQRSNSDTNALFRAALSSVKWNTSDSSSTYNSYTSNLDEFVTSFVSLD